MRHIFQELPGSKVLLDLEDPEVLALFDEDLQAFASLYVEGKGCVFLDEFPVGVKAGAPSNPGKSLRSFLKKYRPRVASVLGTGNVRLLTIEGASVLFPPCTPPRSLTGSHRDGAPGVNPEISQRTLDS